MLRFLPFLILGPFTGPLAAGACHYALAKRWFMAATCVLGIAEVWLGLPAIASREISFITHYA